MWGALAAAAALFPGAATLLGADIPPSNSLLKTYYTVVPTVAACFCLLLLTTYKDSLFSLSKARRLASRSFLFAIILLFSFVAVKLIWLDRETARDYVDEKFAEVQYIRSHGLVKIQTTQPQQSDGSRPDREMVEYGDPVDFIALVLLTNTFAGLTVAFGALGLNVYYQKTRPDNSSKGEGADAKLKPPNKIGPSAVNPSKRGRHR